MLHDELLQAFERRRAKGDAEPPTAADEAAAAAAARRETQLRHNYDVHVAEAAGLARRQAAAKAEAAAAIAHEVRGGLPLGHSATASHTLLRCRQSIDASSVEWPQLRKTMSAMPSSAPPVQDTKPSLIDQLNMAIGGRTSGLMMAKSAHGAATSSATVPLSNQSAVHEATTVAAAASPSAEAFAKLLAAGDVSTVQAAYDTLLTSLGFGGERAPLSKLLPLLLSQLPHRSRQLLETLEARAAQPQYCSRGHDGKTRGGSRGSLGVLVLGAGPCGLKVAIELALLGTRVEVLERRQSFSRLQVLHLWECTEADLIDLGIKLLDPSIFAAADKRRCTTCQLQHSLLKIALLLGVRVHFGCHVHDLASLAALYSARRLDVLVDASGARCDGVLSPLGFSQAVALRSARALCLVISLMNCRSATELQQRESTWSSQYFQAEFGELHRANGVALENFVYYRSTGAFAQVATHYFVMTTNADALHAFGALRAADSPTLSELCATSNIDLARLEAYARAAVATFVPPLAKQPLVPGQLSLFDYSERRQSNRAAAVVPGSKLGGAFNQSSVCIVTRVGDALQEVGAPKTLAPLRAHTSSRMPC